MKSFHFQVYCALKLAFTAALLVVMSDLARAEMASIYGGRDGLCGRPTASGERLNCAGMTAAHRTLAFGSRVRVCHNGCVTVGFAGDTSICHLQRLEPSAFRRPVASP